MTMTTDATHGLSATMDAIISLCKRKGFIFPSSEIYGGCNGFFDYGPLGIEMKKNIRDAWWQDMVRLREDMVGLDTAIIMNPAVWSASGHISGFSDPMVDCKDSKMRYRADQLYFSPVVIEAEVIGYISVQESDQMLEEAQAQAEDIKRRLAKRGQLQPIVLKPYTEAQPHEYALIPSPETRKPGSLTPPRAFNLMFQTSIGALSDEASVAYLRPETAQGIFVNFKNVLDSSRVKVPFGIAQIGKAFRNEITPRNFIVRSREFEQMEIEYFIPPEPEAWEAFHQAWIQTRLEWHKSIGLRAELLSLEVHAKDKLAHYAKACTDIMFHFPFGIRELEGIAARGDFDLTQHARASGKPLEYFDEARNCRYTPHVIEPSVGVDRLFLALLCSAYQEDEIEGEKRCVLRLHPRIAPIKVAVLPLVKNKPPILELATVVHKQLQKKWNVAFDASGAIGRRYRRMDEVGTPFCVTIDYTSLEDGTVTVRDRDSTQQHRLPVEGMVQYLSSQLD